MIEVKSHARGRLHDRLGRLVSIQEVLSAVRVLESSIPSGDLETWVQVKKVQTVRMSEKTVGNIPVHGDTIWAVCFKAAQNAPVRIVTVLVRHSAQPKMAGKIYLGG